MLAWAHARAIENVLKQVKKGSVEVIIDEFAREKLERRLYPIKKMWPLK